MTTVPTSVDEAKKMGEDLIKTKGGAMLSKLSGTRDKIYTDMKRARTMDYTHARTSIST